MFKKKRAQTFVEYVLIVSLMGLVLAASSTNLFQSVRGNFWRGLLPTNAQRIDLPEPPAGMSLTSQPPTAVIGGPSTGAVGQTITLLDHSHDNDGRIVRNSWGSPTEQITLAQVGVHTVFLTVWDNDGLSGSARREILVINGAPVAAISVAPGTAITPGTDIVLSGRSSTDPDGHAISRWEWHLNGVLMNWPLETTVRLPAGTHQITLRVMDEYDLWGPVASRNITVNNLPVAVIGMTPSTGIDTSTIIAWSHLGSFDPDGGVIAQAEWINAHPSYSIGTHTVQLRVRDSVGDWSPWVSRTFTVGAANRAPVAAISMTPGSAIDTSTVITWSHVGSSDPDGHTIANAEWINRHSTYSIGTHTVQLRVVDSLGAWSPWVSRTFTVVAANRPPVAVISMTPGTAIDTSTFITWGHAGSTDPDGHAIVNTEWTNMHSTYAIGTHTVQLRVQDSLGLWSAWVPRTFTVVAANRPPVAVISMTPSTGLTASTFITWGHAGSSDPDGHTIANAEWINRLSSYPVGTHTVQLRVQDSLGLWSPWATHSFTIGNRVPVAVIGLTPSSGITTDTVITWNHAGSSDPDGHAIINAEWLNRLSTYPVGSHSVSLRVQDSLGLWSSWATHTISVTAANRAPTAAISMTPSSGLTTTTSITWGHAGSSDPDGHAIVNAEWQNRHATYAVGTHTVQLRVQDSLGLWSPWASHSFTIGNRAPVAVIGLTPSSGLTTASSITWNHAGSSDPDGHAIANAEWLNRHASYTVGTHTVQLRVQDSLGLWSPWVSQTITVGAPNRPPVAVISVSPSTGVTSSTTVTWGHALSSDPDGHAIVNTEWVNRHATYTAGTHLIQLRVQDSLGLWSSWASHWLTVVTNNPPLAHIGMSPNSSFSIIDTSTVITWSHDTSRDPDGHAIVNAEWLGRQTTYPAGTHTVQLRVQDSHGLWSGWVSRTFTVVAANRPPVAVIGLSPSSGLTTASVISWNHALSSDPDGNSIVNAEWSNRHATYSAGSHAVSLRVQDSLGLWSPWVTMNIVVSAPANRAPNAVIGLSPSSGLTTASVITWNHASSWDPDSNPIINAEWINRASSYAAGTHTVFLRVQDSLGLWSAFVSHTITVSAPANRAPNAVIGLSPSSGLTTASVITWNHASSWDPDFHSIINAEWTNRSSSYAAGTHTVSLRVQDALGLWSSWVSRTITVSAPANRAPNAVIGMNPSTGLTPTTNILWNHASSWDPDGHAISSNEWSNRFSTYTAGTHTVSLRVKDSLGLWSSWVSTTFTVTAPANRPPVAVIGMTPSTGITPATVISWSQAGSWDPDGHTLHNAQWFNMRSTYTVGTHTVELRIQDSLGLWSPWVSRTFTVTAPITNRPPVAVIGMTPSTGIRTSTWISWSQAGSWDPDGHTLHNAEWDNMRGMYSVGTHTVRLRLQDSFGLWSTWASRTFAVTP